MLPPKYYGHSQPLGDLDIFASSGRTQPACNSELPKIMGNPSHCNHEMSRIYLLDSIRRPEVYIINNTQINWGFYAQNNSGNYNLTDETLPHRIPDFV